MLYSFVSTVISDERRQLRQGTRLLAEIAHNHGIPITWAVDGASASAFAGALTQWHESHGDELLLMLDITPIWETEADLDDPMQAAEHIVTVREKLPDYISSEWRKVERAMPWGRPILAGAEWKHHVLLHALEQVGFKGLWGYRWENGDDRGDARSASFIRQQRNTISVHTLRALLSECLTMRLNLHGPGRKARTRLTKKHSRQLSQ